MDKYEIIVDNIGCVYRGSDRAEMEREWAEWCEAVGAPYGRPSGECVTLYVDGEPEREYSPATAEQE